MEPTNLPSLGTQRHLVGTMAFSWEEVVSVNETFRPACPRMPSLLSPLIKGEGSNTFFFKTVKG